MITFIRHGEKMFANGKGKPRFDPQLKESFRMLGKHYVYYNSPNVVVYSSPYKRCRETALIFSDTIKIDCRLGEYLGNWKPSSVNLQRDFHPETIAYATCGNGLPPPKETFLQMKVRMLSFFREIYENLSKSLQESPEEISPHIIVVSHGLPIEVLFETLKDSKRTISDDKKLSLGYVEGFTVRIHEKDIIPTRYYNDTDRDWCDNYGYDHSVPLAQKFLYTDELYGIPIRRQSSDGSIQRTRLR
jgi:broad specificity phosphatase PhoE